jgi:hypothetical protein
VARARLVEGLHVRRLARCGERLDAAGAHVFGQCHLRGDVDEAGEHGLAVQIADGGADGRARSGLHGDDAAVADLDGAVGDDLARLGHDARVLQREVARWPCRQALGGDGALLRDGETRGGRERERGERAGERMAHRNPQGAADEAATLAGMCSGSYGPEVMDAGTGAADSTGSP